MMLWQLHIVALTHSIERRRRLDGQLRDRLASEMQARKLLAETYEEVCVQEVREQEIFRKYEMKIAAMTSGEEYFSLAFLNACRNYASVIIEKIDVLHSEIIRNEAMLSGLDDEINRIKSAISRNVTQIERCESRRQTYECKLDMAASDAADAEAEEMAVIQLTKRRTDR